MGFSSFSLAGQEGEESDSWGQNLHVGRIADPPSDVFDVSIRHFDDADLQGMRSRAWHKFRQGAATARRKGQHGGAAAQANWYETPAGREKWRVSIFSTQGLKTAFLEGTRAGTIHVDFRQWYAQEMGRRMEGFRPVATAVNAEEWPQDEREASRRVWSLLLP
mgnify:CR=1 FL=1